MNQEILIIQKHYQVLMPLIVSMLKPRQEGKELQDLKWLSLFLLKIYSIQINITI